MEIKFLCFFYFSRIDIILKNGIMFWNAKCTIYVYDVKQGMEKRRISDSCVGILCAEGKVSGVTREGYSWMSTCSILLGKAVCKLAWNMDKKE